VETVATSRTAMMLSLDEVRRTPLDQISVTQANDIVRRVLRREDSGQNAVEVARFGSSI
jgi:hypothetical protein